jgi:serine/threonine protein kinase
MVLPPCGNSDWVIDINHPLMVDSSFGILYPARSVLSDSFEYIAKWQTIDKYSSHVKKEKFKNDIVNEIKMHTRISDMGLTIPIIDMWKCDDLGTVIITERLEKTFGELLADPSTPDSENVRIVREVASILDELHNNNICHRDSHSHNFMRAYDGKVYIIDFGTCIENCVDKQTYTLDIDTIISNLNVEGKSNLIPVFQNELDKHVASRWSKQKRCPEGSVKDYLDVNFVKIYNGNTDIARIICILDTNILLWKVFDLEEARNMVIDIRRTGWELLPIEIRMEIGAALTDDIVTSYLELDELQQQQFETFKNHLMEQVPFIEI